MNSIHTLFIIVSLFASTSIQAMQHQKISKAPISKQEAYNLADQLLESFVCEFCKSNFLGRIDETTTIESSVDRDMLAIRIFTRKYATKEECAHLLTHKHCLEQWSKEQHGEHKKPTWAQPMFKNTPLLDAIKANQFGKVANLMNSETAKEQDAAGNTALHLLASYPFKNRPEMLEQNIEVRNIVLCLLQFISLTITNHQNQTAITLATDEEMRILLGDYSPPSDFIPVPTYPSH